MEVQIVSDLHLEIERQSSQPGHEFYHYTIPVNAENLALLGDIGCTVDERLFGWLEVQLKSFKTVYFVSGNHEPYHSSIDECISKLDAFSIEVDKDDSLGKFVYLNRTRHDVSPSLTILGCTLWSALNPDDLDILSWSLNDFRRIDSFNPTAYDYLHRTDLEWLNTTVSSIVAEEPHRKIAIFTHHAPTVAGTGDPKFIGGPTNSAFATELTVQACWTAGNVALWAFGHTHWSCDLMRDGVRVYSNQRGYGDGGPGYDARKVIKL